MSKIAERLEKCFTYDPEIERTILAIKEGEDYNTLLDLLYNVAKDVDDDTAYDEVAAALGSIADEGIEYIEDNLYDYCEPTIYTQDLLRWTGKSANNLTWCNEAMTTFQPVCFSDIIMYAQGMAKAHVWQMVIDFVREMEEEGED